VAVGYRLYREIRDFAPPDWTPGELVVALMIADDAKDETRRSWIANAELCYRTRLGARAVRKHLCSLAARGFEFRVIHGYDMNGSPVFAAKGHAVDYLVPDMLKGGTDVPALSTGPLRKGGTIVLKGGTDVPALSRKGGTDVPPLPSENLNPPQIPSHSGPDLTPPEESARAGRQVKPVINESAAGPAADPLAAEFARQANGLREFAKNNPIQENR
jgi:hypothetical protein